MQTFCPESGLRIAPNRPKIRKMTMTFDRRQRQIFFDVVLFLLLSLVTGSSFMSISSLVLKLWQFSFIIDWTEIRKSEIPTSEFFPISGDWGVVETKIGTNVSNRMLPHAAKFQRYSFYRFWVIKGKPTGGSKTTPPPPTQIRVKFC